MSTIDQKNNHKSVLNLWNGKKHIKYYLWTHFRNLEITFWKASVLMFKLLKFLVYEKYIFVFYMFGEKWIKMARSNKWKYQLNQISRHLFNVWNILISTLYSQNLKMITILNSKNLQFDFYFIYFFEINFGWTYSISQFISPYLFAKLRLFYTYMFFNASQNNLINKFILKNCLTYFLLFFDIFFCSSYLHMLGSVWKYYIYVRFLWFFWCFDDNMCGSKLH